MTRRDRAIALLVVLVWGVQFPMTTIALRVFPPFLLGALRFLLVAVPTIAFVPRPRAPLRWLVGYGLGLGFGEFALLYLAIRNGMPAGLASVVLQSSAPFTVLLAVVWLRERTGPRQFGALAVATAGIVGIAVHTDSGAVPLLALLLTLGAGFSWAIGNICARQAQPDNSIAFTLWMAVVPPVPMAALSLTLEGPHVIARSITSAARQPGLSAVLALAFIAFVCTIAGTGGWAGLLVRYPAQMIAPLSILVPVVGIASSAVILGERMDLFTLAAGAVVLAGVLGAITGRRPATPPDAAPEPPAAEPTRERTPQDLAA